ncbi:MAG: hypothetical protein IJS00_04320 [Paludibacteraceae bacterium]|nr:hypothetical protein [Paludibacteraceae bacterium]
MLIKLTVPTVWEDLTPTQYKFACSLIGSGLPTDKVKTYAFLTFAQWNNLHQLLAEQSHLQGQEPLSKTDSALLNSLTEQITEFLPMMNFLTAIPNKPIRWNEGAKYDPYMHSLPFEHYLAIENLLQGYMHTRDPQLILNIRDLLYNTSNTDKHATTSHNTPNTSSDAGDQSDFSGLDSLTADTGAQVVNTLLWVVSVKKHLAARFPHLFRSVPPDPDGNPQPPTPDQLINAMDWQLLTLTDGDITKEPAVLQTDTYRALTYLNKKAQEQQKQQ